MQFSFLLTNVLRIINTIFSYLWVLHSNVTSIFVGNFERAKNFLFYRPDKHNNKSKRSKRKTLIRLCPISYKFCRISLKLSSYFFLDFKISKPLQIQIVHIYWNVKSLFTMSQTFCPRVLLSTCRGLSKWFVHALYIDNINNHFYFVYYLEP